MADKRNKSLVLNTFILGIGQLIPRFITLITLPLLTSFLSTDQYGLYDLLISLTSLLLPLLTMQIQQATFRYLIEAKSMDAKRENVSDTLCFVAGLSCVAVPVIYLVLRSVKYESVIAILVCLMFVTETFYSVLGQIIRGLGFNFQYSMGAVIYAFVNAASLLLLLVVVKLGLYGVLLSMTIAFTCSCIYYFIKGGMGNLVSRHLFSVHGIRKLLNFSAPIVPSSISLWVVNFSDRIVITQFLGMASNGIYAVANRIPGIYNAAYGIFYLAWTESAAKAIEDEDTESYYSELFGFIYNLLIGLMLVMIAVTPFMFRVFVRGDFASAISQVPILYFGVFFNSLVNYYSGIYLAIKRTKQVGISSLFGAIINVVINVFLIKHIGLYAASISTVISFVGIVLYRAYDLNKVITIKYNKRDIVIGIVLFTLCAVLLGINKSWTIGACGVIAFVYNIFFNRSYILKLVSVLKGFGSYTHT